MKYLMFLILVISGIGNLNAQEFPICAADSDQLYPDVAFDGTNFWVVWGDKRSGISQIYGARVTPQGVLLDDSGILLASLPDTGCTTPSVAFGDTVGCTAFYIATPYDTTWHTFKNIGTIRFHKDGNLIDIEPSCIEGYYNCAMSLYYKEMPLVEYGDDNFCLILGYMAAANAGGWWEYFDCCEVRAFGNTWQLPGFQAWSPTGIWNGKNFFSVWTQWPLGDNNLVSGCFINDSMGGQSIDSAEFKIRYDYEVPGWPKFEPSTPFKGLAYGGSKYLFISETDEWPASKIWYDILSDSGRPINSLPSVINNGDSIDQVYPVCAYKDGKFLSVWQACKGNTYYKNLISNLYGAAIDTFGNVVSSCYINGNQWNKIQPSIAVGGGKYLLVWADNRRGNYDIRGIIMDSLIPVKKDIAVLSIDMPKDTVYTNERYGIKASVINFGHSTNSFYVVCVVDTGDVVYCDSEVVSLGSEDWCRTGFYYWDVPADTGINYNITVYSILQEDENYSNDTIKVTVRSIKKVGIEEGLAFSKPNLKVFSNPFTNTAIIKLENSKITNSRIKVYDISGKLVEEAKGNVVTAESGCSIGKNLKAGIYFVKAEGCKRTLKIVKLK